MGVSVGKTSSPSRMLIGDFVSRTRTRVKPDTSRSWRSSVWVRSRPPTATSMLMWNSLASESCVARRARTVQRSPRLRTLWEHRPAAALEDALGIAVRPVVKHALQKVNVATPMGLSKDESPAGDRRTCLSPASVKTLSAVGDDDSG